MVAQGAIREEEARSRFYLVDKQGLLFDDMTDLSIIEQKPFARKRSEFTNTNELTNLHTVIKAVQPGNSRWYIDGTRHLHKRGCPRK